MVRLLILSCFLLSYFVNINTLLLNDEVEVGFRDLFNRALPENYAVDTDQTSVVYRRPRYAGCLKCDKFSRLPVKKPREKQVVLPPAKSEPQEQGPGHKPKPNLCSACGTYLAGHMSRLPPKRNGARGPEYRLLFPKIKAAANRVSTTILKWLQKKTA